LDLVGFNQPAPRLSRRLGPTLDGGSMTDGNSLPMAFFKRLQDIANAIRGAGRPADVDGFVASQIERDSPGLALAVVAHGTVVHAAGYGMANVRRRLPAETDTIFHLASGGKQFTGLGILMLAEEGKLGLDDPVGKHIPLAAGFGPGVTIRRLLHHTSGIRDLYDDDGAKLVLARCERPTNADVIRIYADLGCPMAGRRIRPGGTFSYSNSGYELLGSVIAEVSGQTYHDFFASRVFDPLAMKDTFSVPRRAITGPRFATGYTRNGWSGFRETGGTAFDNLVGSGSFYTTVSDLCRYDQALRTHRLVGAASVKEAFTSGRTNDGSPTNYGFGWALGTYDGIYFADHEGEWDGFYSYICYCLDRPLSIFALSNNPEADLLELANVAAAAYR
jgi:CubicO group peptidase (beta-lactamase class C family)